jgi:ATP synthase protein I
VDEATGAPSDERREPEPDAAGSPSTSKDLAKARFESLQAAGAVGSIGLSFVFAIVIGAAFGWWLDTLTGWSPVGFLVFFFIGLAAGFRNVYVATRRYLK